MAKNKAVSVQKLNLQIDCMRDMIDDLLRDQEIDHEEIKYLSEFISYKQLDEEYWYFRKNAHEEYKEGLPFPFLTL